MTGMDHNDRFLRSIFQRFLVPTILSVLGGTVNALVDSAIVGNMMGPDALAAINLCGPVFLLFSTVGALLGTGEGCCPPLSLAGSGRRRPVGPIPWPRRWSWSAQWLSWAWG